MLLRISKLTFFVLILTALAGCGTATDEATASDAPALQNFTDTEPYTDELDTANMPLTVSTITTDVEDFVNEQVIVQGLVSEQLGPHAFVLSDSSTAASLLVLGVDEQVASQVASDALVRVRGTVQRFVPNDIAATLGYEPDQSVIAAYENQPVLIATAVHPTE